jgi:hypothetical protein
MAPSNARFVVHMDILGMSHLVRLSPELAWRALSALVEARNHVGKYQLTFLDTAERTLVGDRVNVVTFSDTIVLFTKSDQLIDLRTVLVVATEIFNKALATCIPIRVGIAHGTFFFNLKDSMYAGPALIDAYELGEGAQWVGMTASEFVYRRAEEAAIKSRSESVVIPAKIPTDAGEQPGYAINWPAILERREGVKLPITAEQFYSGFAQYFGPYDHLAPRARAKYENTVHFFNAHATAA